MLTINDLNDLHYIIVHIRFRPLSPDNEDVLRAVLGEVKELDTEQFTDNTFRQALMRLNSLKEEYWETLLCENRYSYTAVIHDESVYRVLTTGVQELLEVVQEKNEDKIYDLADALHNLPTLINKNDLKIPKSFWKIEIWNYRKKWDPDFLKEEQKQIAGRLHRFFL